MQKIIVNPNDMFGDGGPFWKNCYEVILSEFSEPMVVNADHEQDALDYAIDYAEKEGWEGLFLSLEETEELEAEGFLEDYISGGDHGRYLSSHNVSIRKVKCPKA